MHTGFWWGNLRERENSEDLVEDGRIIVRRIIVSGMWGHGQDRYDSGQGKVAGTVNAVMNLRVP